MAIQWFPGHMHLTRQALGERLRGVDVVIELLDARLPGSSANPMLARLVAGKPCLKVLNKRDLADPERTALWLEHYRRQPTTQALELDSSVAAPAQALVRECRALAPGRGSLSRPLKILVCGIPNVGKSTLINTLKGSRAARVADEPGVTRTEQRVVLEDGVYLFDTPGVLWPRIIVERSGYNLAASGAIGRNAFDDVDVALQLLEYLLQHYAPRLLDRYHLAPLSGELPEAFLERAGRACGALQRGGVVNLQKAAERVLHDFRSGALGGITLETPSEFARWLKDGRRLDAERQLRKEAMLQARSR